MQIDILCSGSKGNCTLIRSGSTSILLDCGPAALRTIKEGLAKADSSMASIQALLITHTHSDHIRQLRHFSWLPVYTPTPVTVKDPKKNVVPLSLHFVHSMMPFRIGRLLITPFALSHDAGPTVGYVMEDEAEKLVYLTDTGYVRTEILPFLRGADYYIVESNHDVEMLMQTDRPWSLKQRIISDTGHLSNTDSARLLARLITERTRQVVLAHLSEEANTPQKALECFTATMQMAQKDDLPYQVCCASQYESLTIGSIDSSPSFGSSSNLQKKDKKEEWETLNQEKTESLHKEAPDRCQTEASESLQVKEKGQNPALFGQAQTSSAFESPFHLEIKEQTDQDQITSKQAEADQVDIDRNLEKKADPVSSGLSIPKEMQTTWAVFEGGSSWLEEDDDDLYADPLF